MSTIEYLESERKKIWERITKLQDLIEKKTTDYEAEARQASKKASEYRNKCESTNQEATAILLEIKTTQSETQKASASINEVAEKCLEAAETIEAIKANHADLTEKKESINNNIAELESLFNDYSTFEEKISTLENIYSRSSDFSTKTEASYNQLISRKREIDQLYYEIIGYKNIDKETGTETEIEGLKHELENSFLETKSSLTKLTQDKQKEFSDLLSKWRSDYNEALGTIQSLLPNALTTGLSYAYTDKKNNETSSLKALEGKFEKNIVGLVIVSLIPFSVSIYQLVSGTTLQDVILQLPRLTLSIMPLYVPVLWIAYSSNKKMNLSKRLVEEYTHKEVLSKTFEGLAEQIRNIKDKSVSEDLRVNLLYNILAVSSENPGKLISDYNKSDHPLMDALEKSSQLTNAVENLSKVPGMGRLASILGEKSNKILVEEARKVEEGLSSIDKND